MINIFFALMLSATTLVIPDHQTDTTQANAPQANAPQANRELIYVGTYSQRGSEGIYVFEFDRKSGKLTKIQAVPNDKSPSFLAIHPSGKFAYSVNEGAKNEDGVNAYTLDRSNGHLTLLNQQSSHGRGPCHISVDKTGKIAFISNYGEGAFTVLPIQADGSLAKATTTLLYTGNGPNKQRQEKPHIHSATISPDNRFVYVSDLGTDKIYTYEIDHAAAAIKPAQTPFISVKPGSGPRHFTFHPTGKFAYGVEELVSAVSVFSVDKKTGALTLIEDNVKTLPADFTGQNTSADIHIDPKGRFLYQSNRGHNSLAILAIQKDGKLKLVGNQLTGGKTPRNFLIDPQGEYLVAANQDTDNVVVFRIDPKTGLLSQVGEPVSVPAPVCLKLVSL